MSCQTSLRPLRRSAALGQIGSGGSQKITLRAAEISSTQVQLNWTITNPGSISSIRIFRAPDSSPPQFELAGEDDEGRIDRNELIRTRPPSESLLAGHRFGGYGDDGRAYDPVHCDLDSQTNICWRDPPPQGNDRLNELSLLENLVGARKVQSTISPLGVVHANPDGWDRTGYNIEFRINPGGLWTTRGYRSFQHPAPVESGTWSAAHDGARDEEVVTFIRQNGLPRATIRIHAARGHVILAMRIKTK